MKHRTLINLFVFLGFVSALPVDAEDGQCQGIRARYAAGKQNARTENAMAYCAAREGNSDLAFKHLDAAIKKGYHNLSDTQTDPDFNAIRSDPRWQGVVERVTLAEQAYLKTINAELYRMYQDDQADRQAEEIDWSKLKSRDDDRYARVLALAAAEKLTHSDDYFHAAMIMQHGDKPEDYQRAHQWAKKAYETNNENTSAAWLACAAEDRYLQAIGKPQIWGTQFTKIKEDDPWTLEPFDRSVKTDAERVAMHVPTIAEAETQRDQMNARPNN